MKKTTKKRTAKIKRKTKETDITVEVNLDGKGKYSVNTGIAFLDHMLDLLSKHSLIDLKIKAVGDREVDDHHTVEDIGLVLGEALDKALGTREGISRYGWALLPMDQELVRVAIDLGGRPSYFEKGLPRRKINTFDSRLLEDFFKSLTDTGRMNLHIESLGRQKDAHHISEAAFKGLARALRVAVEKDPRVKGVPSSKGRI